ncbi:MAG: helix-turn-helix domain-containing protein, partial [Spirochaetota bacterium]
AVRLLEEGDRPIKEIAFLVGYQDPNYFSRIFKKFRGVSPTTVARREGEHA